MIITRTWAMPSPWTFSIPPIAELLLRYIPQGHGANGPLKVIDPFSGQSDWAQTRNDLAISKQKATEWLDELKLIYPAGFFDVALLDPPYSPRQISESYRRVGLEVSSSDTQNAKLYKDCKDGLDFFLKSNGIAITCGWNSAGFGQKRGYEILEILLVAHGAAHNDTIVTVERKR